MSSSSFLLNATQNEEQVEQLYLESKIFKEGEFNLLTFVSKQERINTKDDIYEKQDSPLTVSGSEVQINPGCFGNRRSWVSCGMLPRTNFVSDSLTLRVTQL